MGLRTTKAVSRYLPRTSAVGGRTRRKGCEDGRSGDRRKRGHLQSGWSGLRLFRNLPSVLPALQSARSCCGTVPDGAVVLASNAHCAIQSFSFADIAYGVQYHMEPTECTIQEWAEFPNIAESLERIAGTAGQQHLEKQTLERIDDFRGMQKSYTGTS